MELQDIGIVALFSAIFSVIAVHISLQFRDYRVSKLEEAVEKLYASRANESSRNSRSEKAERMQMAMLEVGQIMKDPNVADKQKAIMGLAMKYPDLALDLLKKGI